MIRIIRFTYRMIEENVINIAFLFVPFFWLMIRACQLYCSFNWNNIMIFLLSRSKHTLFFSWNTVKVQEGSEEWWLIVIITIETKTLKGCLRETMFRNLSVRIYLITRHLRALLSLSYIALGCSEGLNNTDVSIYIGPFRRKINLNGL